MNTAQLTPRAQAVIAASDEYTAPIFRERPGAAKVAPSHKTCRQDDGRCGICGGDWSVCGCDGMLRRAAIAAATEGAV